MPVIRIAARDAAPHSPRLVLRSLIDTVAHLIPRKAAVDTTAISSTPSELHVRQNQGLGQGSEGVIPTYYKADGPSSGTVVGIVLGSVVGFLLLVWLIQSLTGNSGAAIAGEEEVVVRRRRSRSPHSRRSRRSTRTEVREYSRSPRRREQIIVEDRRAPPPPRPRSRSILVEERVRVPGDDVVEVIEEHDDYVSRRGSRRGSSHYRGY